MHLIPHQATDTVKDGVRGVYLLLHLSWLLLCQEDLAFDENTPSP